MKHKFLFLMMTIALTVGFASCSNDEDRIIWDFSPINYYCFITDNEGHDLLDSTYQGNILKGLSVIYQDKTYPIITWDDYLANRVDTRAYMPNFYGLLLNKRDNAISEIPASYYLSFGEFAGNENVELREITLVTSDGKEAKLSYSNKITWSNDEPIVHRSFYVNSKAPIDEYGKKGIYHFNYDADEGLIYVIHNQQQQQQQ